MPVQIVIPDKDPLVTLLERRAIRRGLATDKKGARKKAAKLARTLISEQLTNLEQHGDPLELRKS